MNATPASVSASGVFVDGDDPFLFKRIRTWLLLIALFLLGQENGIFSVAIPQGAALKTEADIYASSPILLLLTITLWTICAGLMFKRVRVTLHLMLQQKAILAFALLAFLSTVWSQDTQLTFRRAVLMFLVFGFAWFFAASYSAGDQMRLLVAAGVLLGVASVAMAVLLPQYGLDSGGEWKGVFGQKNVMGHCILFLFSGLIFRPISNGRQLVKIVIVAILPIGLIVMSQSRGSLLLAALLVAVRICAPILKRSRRDQLPFLLYAMFFVAVAIAWGRDMVLSLLGRNSTLTGRTDEWSVLASFAARHLWLGYGYQAFWTGTGASLQAMESIGGAMHGSDSGYLDTMLQFGLVGMAIWLVVIFISARDSMRVFRRPSVSLAAYWYFGIILATLVGSYTDTLFLIPGGVPTFIFVVACAGLARTSHERAPAIAS